MAANMNGSNVIIKNGSLEGEQVSAEGLRAFADAVAAQRDGLAPAYSYTTESSEQTAQIQFDVRDASNFNGTEAIAASPAQYVEALEASIDATFNGQYFKDAIHQTGVSVEFRPAKTQPTPMIRHQFKTANVVFDPSTRFISVGDTFVDGSKPNLENGKVEAGAEIHIKPLAKSLMFNASTRIYDHSIMGAGFTAGSLETTLIGLIKDVELSLGDSIVSVLDSSEAVRNVQVTPLKTKGRPLASVADDILDAITMAGRKSGFADNLNEMALIVPSDVEAALLRVAQRNGHNGENGLVDMLGCSVFSYRDANRTGAIYIAPRHLLMLSWRSKKDGSGDVFNIEVTRDAPRQAWVIELNSVIDLVADAFTTWKADASGDFSESDYFDTSEMGNNTLTSYDQIQHIIKLTFNGSVADEDFNGLAGISATPLVVSLNDTAITEGDAMNISLGAYGGAAPYSFEVKFKGGALPTGVTIKAGAIQADVMAAAMAGEYEISVTDGFGSKAQKAITVSMDAKVTNP